MDDIMIYNLLIVTKNSYVLLLLLCVFETQCLNYFCLTLYAVVPIFLHCRTK